MGFLYGSRSVQVVERRAAVRKCVSFSRQTKTQLGSVQWRNLRTDWILLGTFHTPRASALDQLTSTPQSQSVSNLSWSAGEKNQMVG